MSQQASEEASLPYTFFPWKGKKIYISFADLQLTGCMEQNINFTASRKIRRTFHSGEKKQRKNTKKP